MHLHLLFQSALEASWQGSLAMLLILAVRPLLGARLPAGLRSLLWTLAVLRLLLPAFVLPASPASLQNFAGGEQAVQRVRLIWGTPTKAFAEQRAPPRALEHRARRKRALTGGSSPRKSGSRGRASSAQGSSSALSVCGDGWRKGAARLMNRSPTSGGAAVRAPRCADRSACARLMRSALPHSSACCDRCCCCRASRAICRAQTTSTFSCTSWRTIAAATTGCFGFSSAPFVCTGSIRSSGWAFGRCGRIASWRPTRGRWSISPAIARPRTAARCSGC